MKDFLHSSFFILNSSFFILHSSFLSVNAQPSVSIAKYQGDRKAAISYTFDDGLKEHYTEVFPRLKQMGLKATFCIIGSKVGKDQKGTPCMTWDELREMHADGQEISSHGFRHRSMEKLSGEALRYEVQHNDTLIYNKVGTFPRTYFYPGNRKTDEALAFCGRDRVGTRTFQVSFGSKRDSLWVEKWIARLLKNGEWGVTMTHGITTGYDAFSDPQLLWNCMAKTARMQDSIWIATFHDVAAYIRERDDVQLKVAVQKGRLTVTPSTSLDKELFQLPLTMIVDAEVKSATQDGKPLAVRKNIDGKALIDFNPHGGKVFIRL